VLFLWPRETGRESSVEVQIANSKERFLLPTTLVFKPDLKEGIEVLALLYHEISADPLQHLLTSLSTKRSGHPLTFSTIAIQSWRSSYSLHQLSTYIISTYAFFLDSAA
jgi:hypothetical protein